MTQKKRQVIECLKDYPLVGAVIEKGTVLTENQQATREAFDATVFTSEDGNDIHFNNSEIVFSPDFHTSFKLLKKV